MQHIAELKLKDVGVKHLTLAAPLLNRKEATVIAATSKLFARYGTLPIEQKNLSRRDFGSGPRQEIWSIASPLETNPPAEIEVVEC